MDRVEVRCLVDNVIDGLLPSTEVAKRASIRPKDGPTDAAPLMAAGRAAKTLRAEHGFSALITTYHDGRSGSVLLDAGMSVDTLAHNMDVLSLDAGTIDAVVLSHGHFDHTGGLNGLRGLRKGLPLIVHPDGWLERRRVVANSDPVPIPNLSKKAVVDAGFDVRETRGPSSLLDGAALVTGEVERTSGFEIGFPGQEALRDGEWTPDAAAWTIRQSW